MLATCHIINCLCISGRTCHSTVLSRGSLYCWGGWRKYLRFVHDNEEKRKITSSVDEFRFSTFKWKTKSITGTPPAGVMSYACTNIDNNILYFGGNCALNNCPQNNLFELNTLTLNWSEIICTTPDNIPMRKYGCRMISFNMNGEDSFCFFLMA